MIFAWDIPIEKGTTVEDPKIVILKLSKGVITYIGFKFPVGCHGMVKVRLRHEEAQLVPLSRNEWITGDDEAVPFTEFFELKTTPYQLKFIGCSPGTGYKHTITVRITVLPKAVATFMPLVNVITKFLKHIGVIS